MGDQEACYLALRQTQSMIRADSPDWQPRLTFFLRTLVEQVKRPEAKVGREKQVLARSPGPFLKVVDFVIQHGRLVMAEAVKLTGANRNTLAGHWSRRAT